jgi:hypothetical protein
MPLLRRRALWPAVSPVAGSVGGPDPLTIRQVLPIGSVSGLVRRRSYDAAIS